MKCRMCRCCNPVTLPLTLVAVFMLFSGFVALAAGVLAIEKDTLLRIDRHISGSIAIPLPPTSEGMLVENATACARNTSSTANITASANSTSANSTAKCATNATTHTNTSTANGTTATSASDASAISGTPKHKITQLVMEYAIQAFVFGGICVMTSVLILSCIVYHHRRRNRRKTRLLDDGNDDGTGGVLDEGIPDDAQTTADHPPTSDGPEEGAQLEEEKSQEESDVGMPAGNSDDDLSGANRENERPAATPMKRLPPLRNHTAAPEPPKERQKRDGFSLEFRLSELHAEANAVSVPALAGPVPPVPKRNPSSRKARTTSDPPTPVTAAVKSEDDDLPVVTREDRRSSSNASTRRTPSASHRQNSRV